MKWRLDIELRRFIIILETLWFDGKSQFDRLVVGLGKVYLVPHFLNGSFLILPFEVLNGKYFPCKARKVSESNASAFHS